MSAITGKSTTKSFSSGSSIATVQAELIKDNQYSVVDASTNRTASNVEWQVTVNNGRVLMNLYYVTDDAEAQSKTVCIKKGSSSIANSKDLISGEVKGEEVTISSREPLLLELGNSSVEAVKNLSAYASGGNTTVSWEYVNNETKAQVYALDKNENEIWAMQVSGNSFQVSTPQTAVTYVVKAQGDYGALSEGKMITVGFNVLPRNSCISPRCICTKIFYSLNRGISKFQ